MKKKIKKSRVTVPLKWYCLCISAEDSDGGATGRAEENR